MQRRIGTFGLSYAAHTQAALTIEPFPIGNLFSRRSSPASQYFERRSQSEFRRARK
jgi:hypothetical protein